jgi:hypothetical protein
MDDLPMWSVPEMFEDTKRAIRNGKSRDRQYNGQKKEQKTNNNSQKLHRTLKIEQHKLH